MTDYIGAAMASGKDLKHYGRKGMKWGQRIFTRGDGSSKSSGGEKSKTKTESSAPAKKSGGSEASAPAKRPPGNIQDNVESSSTRYARLDAQAKSGRASEMTEQDLKFYNARTDALAKINKMNEVQPSWLRETGTKVIQQAAQRQMQSVTDALADKYIGDPIKNALKGAEAASTSSSTKGSDSNVAKAISTAAKNATKTPVASTSVKPPGMTVEQSIQYFRDNPAAAAKPKNYSPSGNYDLFKTLREQGLVD
jgi:hypothetical protein